jgi:hypothetical protein
VLDQQPVDGGLRHGECVRMGGVEVGRRGLGDGGEAADRHLPAELEEPVQQTALVHHLDTARVQAECADDLRRFRVPLHHDHLDAVQPQLGGQHHAGRSAAGNDHVDHENPRFTGRLSGRIFGRAKPGDPARSGSGPRFSGTNRGLRQVPPCAIRWMWQGEALSLPFGLSSTAHRPRTAVQAVVRGWDSSGLWDVLTVAAGQDDRGCRVPAPKRTF